MFLEDPQVRIREARPLIKEITNSLRKFSSDASIIVGLNRVPPSQYYQMLLPSFDKCIRITNGESDGIFLRNWIIVRKKIAELYDCNV